MNWWKRLEIVPGNLFANAAIWLIALLPVIVYANISYPFEFARFLIFLFVLPLLVFGALVHSNWGGEVKWWRSPLWWLIIAWLIVTWISALFGFNFYRSWWGTVSRSTSLLYMNALIAMLFLLLVLLRQPAQWLKLLALMSWVGGVSAGFAVLQKLGINLIFRMVVGERIGGLEGNPIFLGIMLGLTFFVTVYFWWQSKSGLKWAYLISLILQAVAIILTVSRGPFLGWIGGLVIMGLGWLWLNRPAGKKIWQIGGIALAAITGIGGLLLSLPIGQRLLQMGLTGTSIHARLLTWKISWLAWLDKPMLGYGWNNAEHAINKFYQPGFGEFGLSETVIDRAHNIFFDQLLANGLVGTVVLVILIISCGKLLLRAIITSRAEGHLDRTWLLISLFATAVTYLLSQLTAFDTVDTLLYAVLLAGAIIFFTNPALSQSINLHWWRLIPALLLLPLIILDLRYLAPVFASARYSVKGDRASKQKIVTNYPIALDAYNQAQMYPRNPYMPFLLSKFPSFNRNYAVELINQGKLEDAENRIPNALVFLNKYKAVNPDNPSVLQDYAVLRVLLYYLHPEKPEYLEKARAEFAQLTQDNPNREYLYLNWARVTLDFKLYDDAYTAINTAAKFTSPPRELEFYRAILGIESKRANKVTILQDFRTGVTRKAAFYPGDQPILERAVDYLVKARDWATAEYYQKKMLILLPRDIKELTKLAQIYAQEGKFDQAEAEARRILQLDIAQEAAVKDFLKQIGRTL